MIGIGSLAPEFDCTAIVAGAAGDLHWRQLHQDQVLVLLFDSLVCGSTLLQDLAGVPSAPAQLARCRSRLGVVCRDPMYELLAAELPFPLIVDADGEIAARYGMLSDDGADLWGHCIIDADGFVRRAVQCDVPVSSTLAELLRYVAAVGESDFESAPC
jgi:hypothetical protein